MQGEQVKLYSNCQLRDLLIPLLIEQTLVMLVGMADTVMVSSLGEAAELIHLRHMLLLADMQISASELRRESRGVFYRSDFPDMDDPNWRKNILIKNTGGRMQLSFRDAVRCVDCQVSER